MVHTPDGDADFIDNVTRSLYKVITVLINCINYIII